MDTILAYGATGECVVKLTALARAAGVDIAQLSDHQVLDGQTISAILAQVGLADAGERTPQPGQALKGLVVDQQAWDALRAAAAVNTGLSLPTQPATPAATGDVSTPATGDGSVSTPGQTDTPSPQGAEATP